MYSSQTEVSGQHISQTLSRKEDESSVRSPHLAASSRDRLPALQTVPETEMIAMLTRRATNSAMPLSKRKNLQASFIPLTDAGVSLDSTRAECRNRLCLE